MSFFVIWIVLVLIIVPLMLNTQNQSDQREKEEKERREREQKEKERAFNEFCDKHPEIKPLSDDVNREYDKWVRSRMIALMPNIRPTEPTYTRGLYKGSLADNISVLSNAQKKEDYDKAMASYNKLESDRISASVRSQSEAKRCCEASERLIEALQKIPGSEAFIADEKKRMESVKSIMEKYG